MIAGGGGGGGGWGIADVRGGRSTNPRATAFCIKSEYVLCVIRVWERLGHS